MQSLINFFIYRERIEIFINLFQISIPKWFLFDLFANLSHKVRLTSLLREYFKLILNEFKVFSVHEFRVNNFRDNCRFNLREVVNYLLSLSVFTLIHCCPLNHHQLIDIDAKYVWVLYFLDWMHTSVDYELLIKLFLHAISVH